MGISRWVLRCMAEAFGGGAESGMDGGIEAYGGGGGRHGVGEPAATSQEAESGGRTVEVSNRLRWAQAAEGGEAEGVVGAVSAQPT